MLNGIIYGLDQFTLKYDIATNLVTAIRKTLRVLEWGDVFSDIVEISGRGQAFYYHWDYFNGGVLGGKIIKLITMVSLEAMIDGFDISWFNFKPYWPW